MFDNEQPPTGDDGVTVPRCDLCGTVLDERSDFICFPCAVSAASAVNRVPSLLDEASAVLSSWAPPAYRWSSAPRGGGSRPLPGGRLVELVGVGGVPRTLRWLADALRDVAGLSPIGAGTVTDVAGVVALHIPNATGWEGVAPVCRAVHDAEASLRSALGYPAPVVSTGRSCPRCGGHVLESRPGGVLSGLSCGSCDAVWRDETDLAVDTARALRGAVESAPWVEADWGGLRAVFPNVPDVVLRRACKTAGRAGTRAGLPVWRVGDVAVAVESESSKRTGVRVVSSLSDGEVGRRVRFVGPDGGMVDGRLVDVTVRDAFAVVDVDDGDGVVPVVVDPGTVVSVSGRAAVAA